MPEHQPRLVMPYTMASSIHLSQHERTSLDRIAERVAQFIGGRVMTEMPLASWPTQPYLVPNATFDAATAHRLGVTSEDDLFGGVVPHAFVATKAISHPLVAPSAHAPSGWNDTCPQQSAGATLAGYSVYTHADALVAGRRLLTLGPLRVKRPGEAGGRGQAVATDLVTLQGCLASMDAATVESCGLVLEHNLRNPDTLCVGQVRMGGFQMSYWGRQRMTNDNHGRPSYGGTDLTAVRGGFEELLHNLPPGPVRFAVDQALVYDAAVRACYPGFFASRINYDVIQGINAAGEWSSGVLEQSWRVGGATPAEIAVLQAFQADVRLSTVRARCIEEFGLPQALPAGAAVYFRGEDPQAGPLTKYALVVPHGDT